MSPREESKVLECEVSNPFVEVQKKIDDICHRLNISEGINSRLKVCERELIVNFPVRMDNGTLKVYTGYRIQHNDTRGPAKGGIRYHPDVSLDETRALAASPRTPLSASNNTCPSTSIAETPKRPKERAAALRT